MSSEPAKSSASGWLKTILGTIAGLFSGAVVMYLTPLVDKVVKPAKPLANFALEHEGLTVTFHNRSTGGSQGWWDFGDGSPLELVAAQQEIITHSYVDPGDYTAKLVLRNVIGEESERTVTLHLDTPRSEPPAILTLEATPASPGAYAPATFRVSSKTKNTQLCVWDIGDDRPLEISTDTANSPERLVTFWKPGGYMLKMAAVNGTQAVERSEIVYVNEPPTGTVAVTLNVTDQATRVETLTAPYTFHELFPPYAKQEVYHIAHQVPARPGYEITDVRLESANGPGLQSKTELAIDTSQVGGRGAKNLCLRLAPDRRSLALSGELIKDTGPGKRDAALPSVYLRVVLFQERRTQAARPAVPVTATLSLPGAATLTLPPLPADWVDPQRRLRLELHDGDRSVWQGSQLPAKVSLSLHNRRYTLTAQSLGNQVRVDVVESKGGNSVSN